MILQTTNSKKCNDVYEVNSKLTQASDDESVFMKQADSNRDLLSVKNENFLKSATNIGEWKFFTWLLQQFNARGD